MTSEERDEFVVRFFNKAFDILQEKGRDYSVNGDPNGNFQMIANQLSGFNKYHIWLVYFTKHLTALNTFIMDGKLESEPIEYRIMDLINYLFILASMIDSDGNHKTI